MDTDPCLSELFMAAVAAESYCFLVMFMGTENIEWVQVSVNIVYWQS